MCYEIFGNSNLFEAAPAAAKIDLRAGRGAMNVVPNPLMSSMRAADFARLPAHAVLAKPACLCALALTDRVGKLAARLMRPAQNSRILSLWCGTPRGGQNYKMVPT